MACSKCKEVIDLTIPEIALSYTTTEKRVMGRDGDYYLITRCLASPGLRPRQGWGVVITINAQNIPITGASPSTVAEKVRKLVQLNDLRISNLNLWFNLNIQWLNRIDSKHQVVKTEELIKLATI